MTGKLRRYHGKLIYPHSKGAIVIGKQHFSAYSPSLDRAKIAKHTARPGYPHEGDRNKRTHL